MWLCGCSDNNARVGSYENNISVYFVHTVPHIRQEKSYDCGLACFKMALRSVHGAIYFYFFTASAKPGKIFLSWCLENKPSKEELETLISKQSFETRYA